MSETADTKSFVPPFATRDWVESSVTIGNRALKQISESRDEISAASGLPPSAWPEKLDGKPALATLLHRGMTRDPEFIRHCRIAVEGRKQKSPFFLFENAMKRLAMEGRAALGISGSEKMSLSEEIEKLLRNNQDSVACQMVFILLAEGYPMFDDDILPPFLFKDGLAPIHPMMRELRLRRHAREGFSRGESEALVDWSEAMNDAIFKLSPRAPSVKSVRIAAGGLRKALTAGAAYESARSEAAPLGDEAGGVTESCRRLEKIAPKMGAAELQKGAAHAAAELEKISTRRFQVDDLRRIQEELGNTRTALDRACEEMEQADTLLREGGFARRHEADSLLSDGVKRAEEELTKLEATLKSARDVKPGAAGVPAREIELAASAAIAALFGADSEDAKGARPAAADGADSGDASGGGAANFDAFDELLVENVVAGKFEEAVEIARVVKAAANRALSFSESEINFIRHSAEVAADAANESAREKFDDAAMTLLVEMGEGEEGAVHPPAAGLSLFTASLACAHLPGESDAEQVMHRVSVDKEFNDAIWPLKRAIEDGRKTGVFFAGTGENGEGDSGAPRVSYKAMRDSVLEAVQDACAMHFNFTLGQRVIQQLARKELGELEESVRENRIPEMERFVHDNGGHKNADRLVEHAVQRVPSNSEKLDGRARKQLVEAVERIAERCKTYLDAAQDPNAENAGGWLRQRRKELIQCCEQGRAAVDDFAVRHAGELAGAAVKRCRERLDMVKQLAAADA